MTSGFQAGGFQTPGYQQTSVVVVVPTTPSASIVGGGWQKQRSGIYWPKKTKKRDELEIIAEVVTEALEQTPFYAIPRHIDVGVLAKELIQANTYQVLRQITTYDDMIRVIKRELEEWDDEDALLLLL